LCGKEDLRAVDGIGGDELVDVGVGPLGEVLVLARQPRPLFTERERGRGTEKKKSADRWAPPFLFVFADCIVTCVPRRLNRFESS
jgi:hypothetical protein